MYNPFNEGFLEAPLLYVFQHAGENRESDKSNLLILKLLTFLE